MRKSVIFVLAFLLSPFFANAQSAQATMKIKVRVVSDFSNDLLRAKIGVPENKVGKDLDHHFFSAKTNELIEKEGILLYKVNDHPNKSLLLSLNPIQRFKNNSGKKIFFIIHSVGYSYTPNKKSIKYFDRIECNKLRTDSEGKVYLWVDGHFFFPESANGEFSETIQFTALQCDEM